MPYMAISLSLYASMPMCHGYRSYRGLLSISALEWRANAGLLLPYRILQYTISLAYKITNRQTNINLYNNNTTT